MIRTASFSENEDDPEGVDTEGYHKVMRTEVSGRDEVSARTLHQHQGGVDHLSTLSVEHTSPRGRVNGLSCTWTQGCHKPCR